MTIMIWGSSPHNSTWDPLGNESDMPRTAWASPLCWPSRALGFSGLPENPILLNKGIFLKSYMGLNVMI